MVRKLVVLWGCEKVEHLEQWLVVKLVFCWVVSKASHSAERKGDSLVVKLDFWLVVRKVRCSVVCSVEN